MPADLPPITVSPNKLGNAFNKLRDTLQSHAPVLSPGALTEHTTHGTSIVPTESPEHAGKPPARFASPRTYAKENFYSEGEIVIILPSADIVSTGAASADDGGDIVKASAGVWIALQGIPIESGPQYHIPKLPMPDETDMDSTSNYWLRISPLC